MNSYIQYTQEQRLIAENLKNKSNVIVDAVAGSGKTTTINHIIEMLSNKSILTILYSKFLTIETRSRLPHKNVDISTIHSICQSSYGIPCGDDFGIKSILKNNLPYRGKHYDIVIIDEAQDLTPLLARVILKIISDSGSSNLIFLGDNRQCIYKFKGADERFLMMADNIFESKIPWTRLKLSETFRCSIPITDFINECMLKENRLVSNRRDTVKPIYICKNVFTLGYDINKIIDDYLKEGNTLNDIAILAFSVRSEKSPVNKLVNFLSSKGKMIYKPNDDYVENNDERLMMNKIVFTTYHQMKGRQRKMVILFGFDKGYYQMAENDPKDECPNLLYVAATRARDRLILIHDDKQGCLPFLSMEKLQTYATIKGKINFDTRIDPPNNIKFYSVSGLVRFMSNNLIDELSKYFKVEIVSEQKYFININTKINFGTYYEDVSFIYGSAVPLIKQYTLQKYFAIYESLKTLKFLAKSLKMEDRLDYLLTLIEGLLKDGKMDDVWKYLPYMINMHCCILERLIHPLNQIKQYDWFYEEKNWKCTMEAVGKLDFLDVSDEFEKKVECEGTVKISENREVTYSIAGSIDCINKTYGPIEFKFVQGFKVDHILQSLVYSCMLYLQDKTYQPYCLYNIMTGEMLKITILNHEKYAETILNKIVNNKIMSNDVSVDLSGLLNAIHTSYK